MDLKQEYKKLYNELIITIEVINELPYTAQDAPFKVEYIKQAFEILKEYSKFP